MLKIRLVAIGLLITGIFIGFFAYGSIPGRTPALFASFPFALGLDLKGGTHLVYRADVSTLAGGDVADAMNSLQQVIERRVNLFGVSEPLVQVERSGLLNARTDERLIVELPGVTDIDQAVALIGETPLLQFKLLKKGEDLPNLSGVTTAGEMATHFEATKLTGRYLKNAQLVFDQTTREPQVSIQFNSEGSDIFAEITKANVGRILGIFLDGVPISLPVIRDEILGGRAEISGGFQAQEAKDLVRNLNYGALPVPIQLISTQTIGASLGGEAVERSIFAGLIGFALVAAFLLFWYRLPGLIAIIALCLYVALNLVLFKLIPVTLTAAGLAAFILSIGMAVDANILIFERMKEELLSGKNLSDSMHDGFTRAWLSIRDSNSSSIITAVILYWLGGTAIIKGFALVFAIGVLASMFTAITVTRTLLFSLGLGAKEHKGLARFLFGNGLEI